MTLKLQKIVENQDQANDKYEEGLHICTSPSLCPDLHLFHFISDSFGKINSFPSSTFYSWMV